MHNAQQYERRQRARSQSIHHDAQSSREASITHTMPCPPNTHQVAKLLHLRTVVLVLPAAFRSNAAPPASCTATFSAPRRGRRHRPPPASSSEIRLCPGFGRRPSAPIESSEEALNGRKRCLKKTMSRP